MKNTYIAIIVLVLVVAGAVLVFGLPETTKKAEAPQAPAENSQNTQNNPGTLGAGISVEVAPVKEFKITGKNFSYAPSSIAVKKGDRVELTFENIQGFHDIVVDGYGIATKQAQSPNTAVLEFTADKAGSFEFYCSVGTHRALGMKGTLVVQ